MYSIYLMDKKNIDSLSLLIAVYNIIYLLRKDLKNYLKLSTINIKIAYINGL